MKKLWTMILLACFWSQICFANELEEPTVHAQGAVLMDYETGRVLWEKNADKQMSMASTTKIMTAIIALEKGDLKDVVTVSHKATLAPKVKMYLAEGEEQRLEDLLFALMLQSYNDAAVAIAEHIGGDVDTFCKWMTEKAHELGAVNTQFKTPNGLDAEGHYSTAYDLALITQYALQNEDFVRIINTAHVDTPVSGGDFKSYSFSNKNRLLTEYAGAIGVKTGFTGLAGQCFVGAAKRDDLQLISVVLASGWGTVGKERKWTDTKEILDYGFENYTMYDLLQAGQFVKDVEVLFAREESVPLYLSEGLTLPLRDDEYQSLQMMAYGPKSLEAPIHEGDILGYVQVMIGGIEVEKIDIYAGASIARHDFKESMKKIYNSWRSLDMMDLIS